jgi:hypothetical protein
MSRTVIDNRRLTRLRARDLPDDFDLTNSYWRYVDYSGWDLSPYIMEDMDIIECVGQNATFPQEGTALIQMRVTDPAIDKLALLDGAWIPPDASSYNHHFVVEGMRQAVNDTDPINIFVREYVAADYAHSWRDALYEAIQIFGQQQVYDALVIAFAGFPRWLSRLEEHYALRNWGPWSPWKTDLSAVPIQGIRNRTQYDLRFALSTNDRYLLARNVENAVTTNPDIPRLNVWFAQRIPESVMFWADRERWRDDQPDPPDVTEAIRVG